MAEQQKNSMKNMGLRKGFMDSPRHQDQVGLAARVEGDALSRTLSQHITFHFNLVTNILHITKELSSNLLAQDEISRIQL